MPARPFFSDDPVAMAQRFAADGAKYLHLVDLDGARDGKPTNHDIVRQIVAAVDMECELGGGVRDEATIQALLETGLGRVVLGTAALKNANWFRQMCEKYPQRLVLGIDARDGLVATDGWLETSNTPATELADQFRDVPLAAIVYTDIATDGMLQGPNVEAMAEMQRHVDVPVVASGGSDDDRRRTPLGKSGLGRSDHRSSNLRRNTGA